MQFPDPNFDATQNAFLFHDRVAAREPLRVALIGNYAPRKCGIATFTTDVFEQLSAHHPDIAVDLYTLDDPAEPLIYDNVEGVIAFDDPQAYRRAARRINSSAPDAIWLQHEYGIFGGECGDMVCDFVDRLAAPLIVTLHTVLTDPLPKQRAILEHLIARSSRIMVMSRQSRDLLREMYDVPGTIISVIEHGAPNRPFGREEEFKARLGLTGRKVMMTFGLLGPSKGIEHVIKALPAITAHHPEVLYRIVGATHPKLVAKDGETYRRKLQALADRLDVADHIEWDNRFLETGELLDQLEACDIYITPYSNLQQSTSGTLSYAVALGKAVVSTPYVHARELLAGDVGVLIEPDCGSTIAAAVNDLLDDPARLHTIQRRAYERGRTTIWPRFAAASAALIHEAAAPAPQPAAANAAPGLAAMRAMTDATGMLQHSIGIVPDRRHGYCIDDNARALMLANVAHGLSDAERLEWSSTFASFIQHAWNEEKGRFRNFMNFDRSWCESEGSEDSNGRTLWALGRTIELAEDADMRAWASRWYDTALPHLAKLGSPRAIAFTMLAAAARLRVDASHSASRRLLDDGKTTLLALLDRARRPDWAWFEVVLGYDNPRLCQALIEAGECLGDGSALDAGIETLRWIARQQTSASGHFRPIGSDSFGQDVDYRPFDQQPLEAQAAIEAAAAAWRATDDPLWPAHALAAWTWFFGANDRGVVLADLASGRCRDGINPRGANQNCGAESILAFQLSHYALIEMAPPRRDVEPGERIDQGFQYSG